MIEKKRISKRPKIYWLPNAITTCSLFAGFYSIVQAMNLRFDLAAIAVFAAMFFDGIDGRVARLTKTESNFGAHYDSLSDMVAFGAAPALILYEWCLKEIGSLGWFATFLYCSCAALRLARFNTNIDHDDSKFFKGLPSPAAAGLVAGYIWTIESYSIEIDNFLVFTWLIVVVNAFSMVTNIKFYSGKNIDFLRKTVPFWAVVLTAFVILSIFQILDNFPEILFVFLLCYFLSGYLCTFWLFFRKKYNKE